MQYTYGKNLFFHRQYKEDESQSEEDDYSSLDASPTYKGLLLVQGLHDS